MNKPTSLMLFPLKTLAAACLLCGVNMAAQAAPPLHYKASNLVSNVPGVALHTDANLQNAWGLAFNPNGAIWVANNHSGTSTLYDGQGASIVGLPLINVPGAAGAVGSPTGIVFNSSQDFTVTPGNPAAFIFANEDGTLAAWNPKVDFLNAKLIGGTIPSPNPIYKGLALAANGSAHYLYATDFHNAKIQVFDSTFTWVDAKKTLGCNFADATIPTGFAPFGIHNIGGALYVTYAKQDANKEDDVAGPGLGYVRVFDANGCLVKRFASTGVLNAPWAVTLAPANFGVNSNKILVGNFGDGTIHAFALDNSVKPAPLLDANDKKIKIDGLWDLAFGNGVLGQNTNSLFFSAGPNDEVNGLYGKLDVAP